MTATTPVTSAGEPLHVETLPSLPGLSGLYARGAASSGRIAAARALPGGMGGSRQGGDGEDAGAVTLPAVAYRVSGVKTASLAPHLRDYQRLVHELALDVLPAGYLHVLAFPLATAVMVRGDFPLPLLGMVHLSNVVEQRGPVHLGDRLEVRAWSENLRPHRRGVQVDLVAEVRTDTGGAESDQPVWRGVSTYLAKGFHVPDTGEAAASSAESPQDEDRTPQGTWMPPMPTGRWALGPGTGRAYGAVSGDRNPIHMSALAAKAFGFPRAIAHGMYMASRALADVGHQRGDAFRWSVEFGKPVLLPGTVDVAVTPRDDGPGYTYAGWSARSRQKYFEGAVTPL